MTEINNNVNTFGYKVEKLQGSEKQKPSEIKVSEEETQANDKILDTGVLGRSQVVNRAKNSDGISSVDEAVKLANEDITMLNCSDEIFDEVYNKFINDGLKPEEAYIMAALGQKEFLETAQNK